MTSYRGTHVADNEVKSLCRMVIACCGITAVILLFGYNYAPLLFGYNYAPISIISSTSGTFSMGSSTEKTPASLPIKMYCEAMNDTLHYATNERKYMIQKSKAALCPILRQHQHRNFTGTNEVCTFVSNASEPKVKFVIGGFQKGGTTSLKKMLNQHPMLHFPPHEQHFFDNDKHYKLGLDYYESKSCNGIGIDQMCGEKTPDYIFHSKAIDRVLAYNRDMKWILIAREPIARAFSQHRHYFRMGWTRKTSFDDAVLELRHRDYVTRGFYDDAVEYLLTRIDRNNLLFLVHEGKSHLLVH